MFTFVNVAVFPLETNTDYMAEKVLFWHESDISAYFGQTCLGNQLREILMIECPDVRHKMWTQNILRV